MSALKEHRVDFDAIKELSVRDFLESELGVTGVKVGSGLRFNSCPNCGDSGAGSYKLTVKKDDRTWRCFSCGEGGSILDAVMFSRGCSLVEAGDALSGNKSHLKRVDRPKLDRAKEDAEIAVKTAKMRKAFSLIQQVCADFKDEPGPLNYLVETRKIPLHLVREAQKRGMVGFMPANANYAREVLLDAVGEDLLRETELWKPDKKLPGISYRPLVFFLPNLSSAEFRHIGEIQEGWTKSIRYGVLEYPYWWSGTEPQCMIVEGAIDMLSAVALGFNGHVMGLTGCNTFKEAWFPAAATRHGLRRYVIALDNDVNNIRNPGQAWANNIKEMLDTMEIPSFIKTPECGDINDILKARSTSKQ